MMVLLGTKKELFNKWYASLRSVIERTFGVWKKKWRILDNLSLYDVKTQNKIVHATMVLHNFIRLHKIPDADFEDRYSSGQEEQRRQIEEEELSRLEEDGQYMNSIRDEIANMIWNEHLNRFQKDHKIPDARCGAFLLHSTSRIKTRVPA
ncbi:hypothetical protein Bca101_030115 [Brassica carinata]